MTKIILDTLPRVYKNNGEHAEQVLAYTLTGEIRKRDSVRFDEGSDIPEYHMSVKSSRFTLATGTLMSATTKEGQIEEYLNRTASELVAYVTKDFGAAYIMTMAEFKAFTERFTSLTRDSMKCGGRLKVRCRTESKKMRAWLTEMVG